jgi:hypothetical protein
MNALISLKPFLVSIILLTSGVSSSDGFELIASTPCSANNEPHRFLDKALDWYLSQKKLDELSQTLDMSHLTTEDLRKLESPNDNVACNFMEQWSEENFKQPETLVYRFYEFGAYYFLLSATPNAKWTTYVIFDSEFEEAGMGIF